MYDLPIRGSMDEFHKPPAWVKSTASFFITINCSRRGANQIAIESRAAVAFTTTQILMERGRWLPEILLLMPDHVHLIASFSWKSGNEMNAVIRDWKRYLARQCGLRWQRGYFDHRIRSENDHSNAWSYIIQNPVKAGLVDHASKWMYFWRPRAVE